MKTTLQHELLSTIKLTKTYLKKSDCTSGNASRITLTRDKKTVHFIYHDNYYNNSNINDYIYSLLLDAQAYEYSYNFADFCNNFGYDSDSMKEYKIYLACKKQAERLHKLFNDLEIEELQQAFEQY